MSSSANWQLLLAITQQEAQGPECRKFDVRAMLALLDRNLSHAQPPRVASYIGFVVVSCSFPNVIV